jgi:hypothetical protein
MVTFWRTVYREMQKHYDEGFIGAKSELTDTSSELIAYEGDFSFWS